MSSGTRYDPGAVQKLIGGLASRLTAGGHRVENIAEAIQRISRLGMSPRQMMLNRLWAHYRTEQYAARRFDWNGKEIHDPIEHEAIAHSGTIPPGFDDAGENYPIKFRKPTAPYSLVKVIVERFTGLLFSERHHPTLEVASDPEAEDFIGALIEIGRFWPHMIQARAYGGAMGTVAMGFQFIEGKLEFEVHDPRWCTPVFTDRSKLRLKAMEKRYMYPVDEVDPATGQYVTAWYWYRRIIDEQSDILFAPAPVADGLEPVWMPEKVVQHGFGFCPVVWVQNLPVQDDIDGDPDCMGIYDLIDAIDALLSQANKGTLANCLGVETPFITEHGVRRFSDYKDGDEVVVLTHVGRWRRAVVKSYGEQQLFNITVGRGRNRQVVRATRLHAWMLEDGIATTDLSVGCKLHKPPHLVREWSYEESPEQQRQHWAQGFAYGDGSVLRNDGKSYGSRIRLCGAKARFLSRFEDLGHGASFPKHSDGEPVVYMRGYCKELPDIASAGIMNVMAFVRGYLDADGSRNLRHPGASDISPFQGIQVTGDKAVEFVRRVFPIVGAYIVNEDDRTEESTNYGDRGGTTVYFSLVLGFSNSPVAPYIVRQIEEGSVEQVWCLEVEDDHSFVLPNGVVTKNCDPTLVLVTDEEMSGVRKGSDNAIKLPSGGNASYMEMTGSGPIAALKMAEEYRKLALEVAQVVLEHPDVTNRTATEIERVYSSMIAKADVMREQYGERCIKPLLEMVLQAVRQFQAGYIDEKTNKRIVGEVQLPPKLVKQENGTTAPHKRVLGKVVGVMQVKWPAYFLPGLTDIELATRSAIAAKAGKVIDQEHAVKFVAEYYRVEDVPAMIEQIDREMQEEQEALAVQALGMLNAPGIPGGGE